MSDSKPGMKVVSAAPVDIPMPRSDKTLPAVDEVETVDIATEMKNLRQSDQMYIKRMEAYNRDRVRRFTMVRRRNFALGIGVAAGILGVYFYTMGAVRQEGFLDDFDAPIPPSQREINV